MSNSPPFALAIHGGAGAVSQYLLTPEDEREYLDQLRKTLEESFSVLRKAGASLDAVESAVRLLEDSPLFNAGKGSVFTSEGKVEMDASIMNGKDLSAGAVTGVKTVRNPVSLARKVMECSPHVLMMGEGAEQFAREIGVETVEPSYFHTPRRWEQFQRIKTYERQQKGNLNIENSKGFMDVHDRMYGTVGAVALDVHGNLSAAVSTGGIMNKRFGRVGDSPIIGSGIYANNRTCAVCCTGHGEYFIRGVVAHDISALIEYKGLSMQAAVNEVIMNKMKSLDGRGGAIAVDANGEVVMAFNTQGMYRGFMHASGETEARIY